MFLCGQLRRPLRLRRRLLLLLRGRLFLNSQLS
jgi:hypothetical protein